MPAAGDVKAASLAISAAVLAIAGLLSFRQWHEWRRRSSDLSLDDSRYFRDQDRRRAIGALVMVLLAVGLSLGSRIPHLAARHANPWFIMVWLGVFGLIFVLLALAFSDLMATRLYARRHRGEIARERLDLLRDTARRRFDDDEPWQTPPAPTNGFPH